MGANALRANSVQLRAAVALMTIFSIFWVSIGLKKVAILRTISKSSLRYSATAEDNSAGFALETHLLSVRGLEQPRTPFHVESTVIDGLRHSGPLVCH